MKNTLALQTATCCRSLIVSRIHTYSLPINTRLSLSAPPLSLHLSLLHRHTLSIPLRLSLPYTHSLSIYLSRTNTRPLADTPSLSPSLSLSLSKAHPLSHPHLSLVLSAAEFFSILSYVIFSAAISFSFTAPVSARVLL